MGRHRRGDIMRLFNSPNNNNRLFHSLLHPHKPSSPSPRIPRRLRNPCSFSSASAAGSSRSFMEVAKALLRRPLATRENVAIRAENKNYSFIQLMSSACDISNFLSHIDLKNKEDYKTERMDGLEVNPRKRFFFNGARIGIVAKPSAEFVSAVFGTWLSGGVAVPLALSYPEAELLHVMNDSDVSVLLSTQDHHELMENVASKSSAHFSLIPNVTSISSDHAEDGLSDNLTNMLENIEASRLAKGDDAALILYTSGTTGKPKGVVHTHNGIISQVQILTEAWEYTCYDQFLHCLPLHHVHGLFNALLAPLYAGSVVEFMPKFSVRGVWQRWRESYPKDGTKADVAITLFTGFVMALSNPLHGTRKAGTVGKPLPRVEAKIIAEDDNGSHTDGVGELYVRSPCFFKEYWKQPEVQMLTL